MCVVYKYIKKINIIINISLYSREELVNFIIFIFIFYKVLDDFLDD